MVAMSEETITLYEAIGGDATIRKLVRRFYELMDTLPEAQACRAVHPPSLASAEEKLYEYLTGYLGGPPLYTDKYGHPRLRSRHFIAAIGAEERDGWILIAARWPDKIPELMADKTAQLDDPRTVKLYLLIGELAETGMDEERLVEVADLMAEINEESAQRGDLERQSEELGDDAFIALMDSFAFDAHPMVERLQELMAERGWTGWIRMERTPPSQPR